jgi:hypothetical protein
LPFFVKVAAMKIAIGPFSVSLGEEEIHGPVAFICDLLETLNR